MLLLSNETNEIMITRDDLYKALISVKNEATGELVYSEGEVQNLIGNMDDDYISYVNRTYNKAG